MATVPKDTPHGTEQIFEPILVYVGRGAAVAICLAERSLLGLGEVATAIVDVKAGRETVTTEKDVRQLIAVEVVYDRPVSSGELADASIRGLVDGCDGRWQGRAAYRSGWGRSSASLWLGSNRRCPEWRAERSYSPISRWSLHRLASATGPPRSLYLTGRPHL